VIRNDIACLYWSVEPRVKIMGRVIIMDRVMDRVMDRFMVMVRFMVKFMV